MPNKANLKLETDSLNLCSCMGIATFSTGI